MKGKDPVATRSKVRETWFKRTMGDHSYSSMARALNSELQRINPGSFVSHSTVRNWVLGKTSPYRRAYLQAWCAVTKTKISDYYQE